MFLGLLIASIVNAPISSAAAAAAEPGAQGQLEAAGGVARSLIDTARQEIGAPRMAPPPAPWAPGKTSLIGADGFEPGIIYTVPALCRGEDPKPYSVCLTLEVDEPLGHEHTGDIPPVEMISDSCKWDVPGNSYAYFSFRTPAFSTWLKATWRMYGWCNDSSVQYASSGIAGLQELESGDGYKLVGATSEHPANHFGVLATNSALQEIADAYKAEFKDAPDLYYNDISLVWGGLFDIDTSKPWEPPHASHRRGQQIDVKMSTVPVKHRERLVVIFEEHGARVLPEPERDHWHLDFAEPGSRFFEEVLRCY